MLRKRCSLVPVMLMRCGVTALLRSPCGLSACINITFWWRHPSAPQEGALNTFGRGMQAPHPQSVWPPQTSVQRHRSLPISSGPPIWGAFTILATFIWQTWPEASKTYLGCFPKLILFFKLKRKESWRDVYSLYNLGWDQPV